MAVEPNVTINEKIELTTLNNALDKADIFTFLVKHREFIEIYRNENNQLNFCGI